jgi:hypothetical protein
MRLSPWVTHERIDDEVMVIHLETGAYFALEGVAADSWTGIISGMEADALVAMILGRYQVDERRARADLEEFLDRVISEGLVEPEAQPAPGLSAVDDGAVNGAHVVEPRPASERAVYRRPVVEKYDDLEELLLFDPIHQVDEAGWPVIDRRDQRE